MVPALFAFVVLCFAAPASASGWHDYRLEIAPGFAVERMNPFQVCLSGHEALLLICPLDDHPRFGPLVEYAVTDEFIITRHAGSKPHERNPSMWQGDPSQEFLFLVRRADEKITGPLGREEWAEAGLPNLSSLNWVEPRNPNFWTPFLGDLFFLAFTTVYFGWPIVLLALAALIGLWLFRRSRRRARAAA
jgi:hypothetical protein